MFIKKKILLFISFIFISAACHASPKPKGQISNFESEGNLAATHKLACITPAQLSSAYTPPDLYNAMVLCITAGKDINATYLFALAGVYTRYDAMRVTDNSAHQAHQVLAMQARQQSDPAAYKRFLGILKSQLGTPKNLSTVCKKLNQIGAPNYYPRYMIQHGMGAFVGNNGKAPLKKLDKPKAWKKSLNAYLHCP